MRRVTKALIALAMVGVFTLGLVALSTKAEAKKKPPLLCGPTILYECTYRDGSTDLVGMTVCEKEKYEKKKKATCVPAAG